VNIPAEMSLVDFVFQTLINCGSIAHVVNAAAIKPIIIMVSIGVSLILLHEGWYLGFDATVKIKQRCDKLSLLKLLVLFGKEVFPKYSFSF
jgi:hypothetical protein